MIRRTLAVLVGGAATLAGAAGIDPLQLRLLGQYALPQRWDNVAADRFGSAAYWRAGQVPQAIDGLQRVRLAPGEFSEVLVPPGESLRLVVPEGTAGDALSVAFASDARLFALRAGERSGSVWWFPSAATQPLLARIDRPAGSSGSVEVAIFVSRRETLGTIAPYRSLLPLPGPAVDLRPERDGAGQAYWRLAAGRPATIELVGPRRLAVVARLAYPPSEGGSLQSWTLRASVEGRMLALPSFETLAESFEPVHVDGIATPVSREQTAFFEVPPGHHQLRLDSSADVYARVLAHDDDDILIPTLNAPPIPAAVARTALAAEPEPALRLSRWLGSVADASAAAAGKATSPAAPGGTQLADDDAATRHAAALRLLADNRWREGALLAGELMVDAGWSRRDDPNVMSEALTLRASHTFFRTLLPASRLAAGESLFAWYLPSRLVDVGEDGRRIAWPLQLRDAALAGVESGHFVPLPEAFAATPPAAAGDIAERVHFASDSAALDAAAEARLAALLARLGDTSAAIHLVGHTDSRASDAYNLDLSRRRAEAVARALNRLGVGARRLVIHAAGKREAAAPNDDETGRALNRRVEISVAATNALAATAPDAQPGQLYRLPPRPARSTLRIVVETANPAPIFVQFDAQPPQRLDLHAAGAGARFAPSAAAAALLHADDEMPGGSTTLGARFARSHTPGRLIEAAQIDLDLPREVATLRLWRGAGAPVRVAVKVLASHVWQLSERAYLDAARRTGSDPLAAFAAALAAEPPAANAATITDDVTVAELDRHWQPLARRVASLARQFRAGVAPPPAIVGGAPPAAAQLAAAEQLAQRGQWLPALEAWSAAAAGADAASREALDRQRIAALEQLGEDFLAEQWLRQRLLYATSPAVRAEAKEWLQRRARHTDDRDALLAVLASSLVERVSAGDLIAFADALLANGESALALAALLALPAAERPPETLLAASLLQRWWQVFDGALAGLAEPTRQAYWRGQRDIAEGRVEAALAAWEHGDEAARADAAHARRGLALAPRLGGDSIADADLAAWLDWQAKHPGPRQWREQADAIVDAAGNEEIYSVDRDLPFPAWRATLERPVRARFVGPVTARIEGRLLHAPANRQPIDGWLRVRSAGQQWVAPITTDLPSPGLTLVGNAAAAPGRRQTLEIEFGAGLHEIEIDGATAPLLARIEFAQPLLPLGLLPPPTPATADYVAPAPLPRAAVPGPWARWLQGCRDCIAGVPPAGGAADAAPQYERIVAVPPHRPRATPARWPTPAVDASAARLAAGDWRGILAEPPARLAGLEPRRAALAARERLAKLLWLAETHPESYADVLAAAESETAAYAAAGVTGLGAWRERIARNSGWVPLPTVELSAGLRSVEIDRWTPESPPLRVRRALLAPVLGDEHLISGSSELVLALFNPAASRLRLELAADDVPMLLGEDLAARIRVDGRDERRLRLPPGGRQQLELALAAGRHAVAIVLDDPLANQFLRVRIGGNGQARASETLERFYHIARADAPVRVRLPGPTWLRIDTWRDRRSEVDYRYLDRAWQEVELPVASGEQETMYRLHLRTPLPPEQLPPPMRPRVERVETRPLPFPPQPAHVAAVRRVGEDALDLAGQQGGTWSYSLGWHERPYHSDSPGLGRRAGEAQAQLAAVDAAAAARTAGNVERLFGERRETFLEGRASYREFAPESRQYRRAELIGRLRQDGGPTLGASARVEFVPDQLSWHASLEARAFVQNPGGSGGSIELPGGLVGRPGETFSHDQRAGRHEWSAEVLGDIEQRRDIDAKTHHTPRLGAFVRYTSLRDRALPEIAGRRVDQDVFTAARAQHGYGIELGDTLEHRPWLDTRLLASFRLTTNPDFNPLRPDRWRGEVAWRQALGAGWLAAHWRHTRFRADADREASSSTRNLGLSGGYELWSGPWHRLELNATLQRESSGGGSFAGLQLQWHFGNGRGFRDFAPGEIDFRELRERLRPAQPNNLISGAP